MQLQDLCRLPWHTPLKHVVIQLISPWFDEPLSRDGYKCQLVTKIVQKILGDDSVELRLFHTSSAIQRQLNQASLLLFAWRFKSHHLLPRQSQQNLREKRHGKSFPPKLGTPKGWICLLFVALDLFKSSLQKNIDDFQ